MLQKINWRFILLHTLAFFFIIRAFETLAYLHNIKLLEVLRAYETEPSKDIAQQSLVTYVFNEGFNESDISYFLLWPQWAGIAGALVAFIISLTSSIRRGWPWINSVLVLLFVYILTSISKAYKPHSTPLLRSIASNIPNVTAEFVVSGTAYLLLGLLILFLRKPGAFINRGWKVDHSSNPAL